MGQNINIGRREKTITCQIPLKPMYHDLNPNYIRIEIIPNIVPDKNSFKVILPDREIGPIFGEPPKEGEYIALDGGKGIIFLAQGTIYKCIAESKDKDTVEIKVEFEEFKPTHIETVDGRDEYIVKGLYKEKESMYHENAKEKYFLFDNNLTSKSQPFDHLAYTRDGVFEVYLNEHCYEHIVKFVGAWRPDEEEYSMACFSIDGAQYQGPDAFFVPPVSRDGFVPGYRLGLKANEFIKKQNAIMEEGLENCAKKTRTHLNKDKTQIVPEDEQELTYEYIRPMTQNGIALDYTFRTNEDNEIIQFNLCEKRKIELDKGMFYGHLFGPLVPQEIINNMNLDNKDRSFCKTFCINGITFKVTGYVDSYGLLIKECTVEITSEANARTGGRPFSTYEFENIIKAQFATVSNSINLEYFAPIKAFYPGEYTREERIKQKQINNGIITRES